MSPDWSAAPAPVPYADLANPQTLNLYAYVKNNPLVYTDPTGHNPRGGGIDSEGFWHQPQRYLTWSQEHFAEEFALWELFTYANSEAAEEQEAQQPSQANAAKRSEIAATAQGYDGSTAWAFDAQKDEFPAGSNKCNKFTGDVTTESGAQAVVSGKDGKPILASNGTPRPPLATEWASKTPIKNWRVLKPGEAPQPGDVAAYKLGNGRTPGATGHSGIVVSVGPKGVVVMAAHSDRVGSDNKFQPTDRRVVYRRYTGE